MSKGPEEQSFKVTDRRLFHDDGERREEDVQEEVPRGNARGAETTGRSASGQPEAPPAGAGRIDFPSYILSYYTQGLVMLGEVANPYTQEKEEEPEAARHIIDILTLLQEKTTGNLTSEEAQLLETVLYELRLKFMARTNRIKL